MKELIGRLLRNDSAINLALIYDLVRAISRIFAAADESLFINKSDKVVSRHSFVNRFQLHWSWNATRTGGRLFALSSQGNDFNYY